MPATAPISSFTAMGAPALNDFGALVDRSDTTDAPTGTTKQIDLRYLLGLAGMPFQGRLSLESGTAVSVTDQIGASTLYLVPYTGNTLALYTTSGWKLVQYNTLALALSGLTSGKPYDIFVFTTTAVPSSTNTSTDIVTFGSAQGWATGSQVIVDSTLGGLTADTMYFWNAASSTTGSFHTTLADAVAGTNKVNLTANITQNVTGVSLELLAWTNDSARATILTTVEGVLVKNGDSLRRYAGSIYTTGTTTTEDSAAKRYVWNYYSRRPRRMYVTEATASWAYASSTVRSANNSTANRVQAMIGVGEDQVSVNVTASANCSGAVAGNLGIGYDVTNANSADSYTETSVSGIGACVARLDNVPASGLHFWQWVESSRAGSITWYGSGGGVLTKGAINGTVWG